MIDISIKSDLLSLLLSGKSQRDIGDITGRSQTNVRYWLAKHNISNEAKGVRISKSNRQCIICGANLLGQKTEFCSSGCHKIDQYNAYIKRWKAGLEDGSTSHQGVSRYIKRYIWSKYGSKCAICGWNEINPISKRTPLEIDHVDGDSSNNHEGNLILLCPNHHSLTPTYKNLNKGKGRKKRKLLTA